jgi:hypothetical protein
MAHENRYLYEAFSIAIKFGKLNAVNRLLELPEMLALVDGNNNALLGLAADYGYDKIVKRLLAFPQVVAKITANNNDALRKATEGSHLEAMNELLKFSGAAMAIDSEMLMSAFVKRTLKWQGPGVLIDRSELDAYDYTILFRLFAALPSNQLENLIFNNHCWQLHQSYALYKRDHGQVLPKIQAVCDSMMQYGLSTDLAALIAAKTDIVPLWGQPYEQAAIAKGRENYLELQANRKAIESTIDGFVESLFTLQRNYN